MVRAAATPAVTTMSKVSGLIRQRLPTGLPSGAIGGAPNPRQPVAYREIFHTKWKQAPSEWVSLTRRQSADRCEPNVLQSPITG